MTKYLVTGGCGFIGSHLVDALIGSGHDVIVIDDLSTGKRENLNSKAELLVGDISNPKDVKKAFNEYGKIDGCFHLAAIASVPRSIEEWSRAHQVNMAGTVNIFEAASRLSSPTPVIYASSAAIYGDNTSVPLTEKEFPSPETPYGADKFGNELQGRIADIVYAIPTMGLRFFNVYGPRQDPSSPYSGVISIFANLIGAGKDITIFGDGTQTRDFIYVGGVVRALIAAMEKKQRDKSGSEVINVCTGRETSINQLAETIEDITGNKVGHNFERDHEVYIHRSLGSPQLMEDYLGIMAETSLSDGLRDTLNSLHGDVKVA